MVQVDVFWSYAIGAGLAAAAGRQIKARATEKASRDPADKPDRWTDPFLVRTLLFCALIFGPSGLYLLWEFPSWETMHAGDRSLPAWLVTLFGITNVTQGLLGYAVVKALIERGRGYLGYLQVLGAYFGMFFILVYGWDGTGYQRFFSPTHRDFINWDGDWAGFFSSDVAGTLAVMGVIMLPIMLGMMLVWMREGERLHGASAGARAMSAGARLALAVMSVLAGSLGLAVLCAVLLHTIGFVPGAVVSATILVGVYAPGSLAHNLYRMYGYADLDVPADGRASIRPAPA